MARYKGLQNAKAVERNFSHIVEMAVPFGGFGRRLDDMNECHIAGTRLDWVAQDN